MMVFCRHDTYPGYTLCSTFAGTHSVHPLGEQVTVLIRALTMRRNMFFEDMSTLQVVVRVCGCG